MQEVLGHYIHILQGVGVGGLAKDPPGPVRHRLGRGQAFGVVVVVMEGLDDLAVDGSVGGLSENGKQAEKQQPLQGEQNRTQAIEMT